MSKKKLYRKKRVSKRGKRSKSRKRSKSKRRKPVVSKKNFNMLASMYAQSKLAPKREKWENNSSTWKSPHVGQGCKIKI